MPCSVFGADIVWVTANSDTPTPPSPDDSGWTGMLTSHGHNVDRRTVNDIHTNLDDYHALLKADLVIISRNNAAGSLANTEEEITCWNEICTPVISFLPHVIRSSRWRWTTAGLKNISALVEAEVPRHALFKAVNLDLMNQVPAFSSFIDILNSTAVGNGTLLATDATDNDAWVVYWETGLEFYPGSGQTAGGPRMFFGAGSPSSPEGGVNAQSEGRQMFLNAVDFMTARPRVNITFEGYTGSENLVN
ncbi:MAG: hypothetical protein AAF492_27910, partial [Verrucomicrobiota bacterium]